LRIERVRKRTAGWAHMYLNIAILVLTSVNLILRLRNLEEAILPVGTDNLNHCRHADSLAGMVLNCPIAINWRGGSGSRYQLTEEGKSGSG